MKVGTHRLGPKCNTEPAGESGDGPEVSDVANVSGFYKLECIFREAKQYFNEDRWTEMQSVHLPFPFRSFVVARLRAFSLADAVIHQS